MHTTILAHTEISLLSDFASAFADSTREFETSELKARTDLSEALTAWHLSTQQTTTVWLQKVCTLSLSITLSVALSIGLATLSVALY